MAKINHFVTSSNFLGVIIATMNSSANATNSKAKAPNSIAKASNSIAEATNSTAKLLQRHQTLLPTGRSQL